MSDHTSSASCLDIDIDHARALTDDLARCGAAACEQTRLISPPPLIHTPATALFTQSLARAHAAVTARTDQLGAQAQGIAAASNRAIDAIVDNDYLTDYQGGPR